MKCTKCGKTFASHTDGPEICWDCYMKDINNYQVTNNPSNCDMPMPEGFFEKATEIFGRFGIAIKDSNGNVKDLYTLLCEAAEVWNKEK